MAWWNPFMKTEVTTQPDPLEHLTSENEYRPITNSEITLNNPIDPDLFEAIRNQAALEFEDQRWIEDQVFEEEEEEEIEEESEEIIDFNRIEEQLDDAIEELQYASGETSAMLIKYMYKQIKELQAEKIKHDNLIYSLEEQLASVEFYKE